MHLRIGLNLGDVIVEESGDVYGEGVNVAARRALNEPAYLRLSTRHDCLIASPDSTPATGRHKSVLRRRSSTPYPDRGHPRYLPVCSFLLTFTGETPINPLYDVLGRARSTLGEASVPSLTEAS